MLNVITVEVRKNIKKLVMFMKRVFSKNTIKMMKFITKIMILRISVKLTVPGEVLRYRMEFDRKKVKIF
tara:strand:+ start:242 stop:448 length:207 start_codon:yes stop_codon:yes gene_type:complete